jgi:hypothetical protein
MFVLLPVFALLLKLGYRQRLYFDHLIFSLHLHSAAYVAMAVMLPLEEASNQHWLPLITQLLAVIYLLAYFVIALRDRASSRLWLGVARRQPEDACPPHRVHGDPVHRYRGHQQLPDHLRLSQISVDIHHRRICLASRSLGSGQPIESNRV